MNYNRFFLFCITDYRVNYITNQLPRDRCREWRYSVLLCLRKCCHVRPLFTCQTSNSCWRTLTINCLREYWTVRNTHCTSYFHHNLQRHRTITSDTAPMTDNCINTKDTWVTVILWQHYYIKMHTDSVTYVNANSRPSFSSSFIVQTLSFMHCTCNFVCGLSDVIIKTLSQSVTDRKVRGADMLACLVWSCSCWTDHRQVLQLFVITVVISVLEKKFLFLWKSHILYVLYTWNIPFSPRDAMHPRY